MTPTPLYNPQTENAAYQLRYSWTGWPSSGRFDEQPTELIESTKSLWEQDGLRVLEHRWTEKMVQILFSAVPSVSPILLAGRAKGRLDHAIRQAKLSMPFSRKVSVRSIGDNTREDVESYIDRQVSKEQFADPRFVADMEELTVVDSNVDLSQPVESARGCYWYNLHIVLVVDGRARIGDLNILRRIRDSCFQIATKKSHSIARLSVMPDHLHAALRGNIENSPLEIVFAFQNNLAFLINQGRIWSDGFYVGTFGEYTTQAIRKVVAHE